VLGSGASSIAESRLRVDPEVKLILDSQQVRIKELQRKVSDMDQRLDTLQTRAWKRLWFRIDGWPGQNNLNAEHRAWRPWHR
jgi:hypothetical protein